jgi:hypothetical protein
MKIPPRRRIHPVKKLIRDINSRIHRRSYEQKLSACGSISGVFTNAKLEKERQGWERSF